MHTLELLRRFLTHASPEAIAKWAASVVSLLSAILAVLRLVLVELRQKTPVEAHAMMRRELAGLETRVTHLESRLDDGISPATRPGLDEPSPPE